MLGGSRDKGGLFSVGAHEEREKEREFKEEIYGQEYM